MHLISARRTLIALSRSSLLALALLVALPVGGRAGDPLAYVPSNAGVFAHLRVGDLWNSPLAAGVRKAIGNDFDKLIAEPVKELGVHPDMVDTVTFFYPTMPMGPGDEQTFVVMVTTNKPYDRENLLKGIRKTRESSSRVKNQNNLKQIGLALVNYESAYGKFPPAAICDKNGKPLLSWRVAILPFIEQQNLYEKFKLDEPWDSEHNKPLSQTLVKVFMDPEAPNPDKGLCHYRVFHGDSVALGLKESKKIVEITDGTSQTFMVVEADEGVPWAKPDDFAYDPKKPLPKLASFNQGGFNVLYADGHVEFLTTSMPEKTLRACITANGGEVIDVKDLAPPKPVEKPSVSKKESQEKETTVPLADKFLLNFTGERTFCVLHQSRLDQFKKGPLEEQKPGPMTEALKLAAARHHFVFGMDFSQLPNEFFTAAPPQLAPFLPLLKSKSSLLFADLTDKELKIGANFICENQEAAIDADRSFKLLMSLAAGGLNQVLKDDRVKKEVGPLLPLLTELERGVNNVKQKRDGSRLEIAMNLKADESIGDVVVQAMKKIREASARAQATNNLKQIGLAMHNYHDVYGGLPAAAICDKKGKPLLSWRVAILPYIDQQRLYQEFHLDEPWDSEHNKKLIEKMPATYAIPGEKTAGGKTHYRVFAGNGAVFDLIQQSKFTEITDGTSNTIMVVEAAEPAVWSKPDDIEYDDKLPIEKLLRFVDGKTTVAYCDGSVRFIKKGIAVKTWHWLIQKADGNPIPDLDE